jgi:hypothetical protein
MNRLAKRLEKIDARYSVWRGATVPDLQPCFVCKKETTGRVKNVQTSKMLPLCQSCAWVKGLT